VAPQKYGMAAWGAIWPPVENHWPKLLKKEHDLLFSAWSETGLVYIAYIYIYIYV
jgi:hypothetical protein